MRIRKYQRHLRREVCKGTTKFLTGKVDSAGILLIRTMRSIAQSWLTAAVSCTLFEGPVRAENHVYCCKSQLIRSIDKK